MVVFRAAYCDFRSVNCIGRSAQQGERVALTHVEHGEPGQAAGVGLFVPLLQLEFSGKGFEGGHQSGGGEGGQFVHRMLATQGFGPFEAAIAANSGWYTLPTLDKPFPEGLGGLGLDEAALLRWLASPMIILAGDRDIATDDPNLPSQPEALAQGPHRLARSHRMIELGRVEAQRRGAPCSWVHIEVPGIGHDGEAMSHAAAAYWFEGRIPEAAIAGALARTVA